MLSSPGPESYTVSTTAGFWTRRLTERATFFVIFPTRKTIRSPALAENVQLSESPTGEMLPVWAAPFESAPCACPILAPRISTRTTHRESANPPGPDQISALAKPEQGWYE